MTGWITNPLKQRQGVLVLGDVVLFLLFVVGTAGCNALLASQPLSTTLGAVGWTWPLLLLGIQILVLYVFNLYRLDPQGRGTTFHGSRLLVAEGVVLGVGAVAWSLVGTGAYGRQLLIFQVPVMVVGGTLWRVWFFASREHVPKRLGVLGTGSEAEAVLDGLRDLPAPEYDVVNLMQGQSEAQSSPADLQSGHVEVQPLPDTDTQTLDAVAQPADIDTLVCSLKPEMPRHTSLVKEAIWLRQEGVEVYDLPSFCATHYGRIPLSTINADWVLQETRVEREQSVAGRARRVVNFLGAAVGLVLAAPLMVLIAAAIKLDSTGPVLFTQQRLGHNRQPFTVYKFRTMVQNAEEKTGPTWAGEEDPRITRVGHVLRKTRLDELPQLFNILKGDMAIVGFRPIRKHFADLLEEEIPFYRLRFSIKPGLTGWPQVRHDYSGSVEGQKKKFEYELFYLSNQSVLLDVYIVVKTVQIVLFGQGQ